MAIKIDKVINLTQDSLNTSPKLVKNLQIAMEPDASIFQYYIANNRAGDKESDIVLGSYDDVKWQLPATHLTTQKVKNIGIKSFPQVGAIGFFTFLNEERSKILAPIHVKSKKYTAPSINVIENDTTLTIVISPPIDYGADESDGNDIFDDGDEGTINEKIKYICHRVILRLDQFALEYVTYENILEVDKPATTGTYDIYCVGYIHEGEAVSEDSNHVFVDIAGTQDTWPGPVEGSDLYITDVEVTNENKVHIRRSDGFQKDSDNAIPVPASATFLDSGKLMITFNNGQTIVSNNAPSGGGGGGSTTQFAVYASAITSGDSGAVLTASCEIASGDDSSTLLAFVTTREETTFSDGWELIHQFEPCYYENGDTRQTMYVLKKSGSANTFTDNITVNVSVASRIYIAMLCLRGVNSITADSSILNLPSINVSTITVNKFKEKSIYAIQAISVVSPTLSVSPNDKLMVIPCGYRLWIVVDISETFEHTFTLSAAVMGLQANVIGIE